ncbi:ABC transporter ATP-binding protein [Halomonas sp.]|uniref:ABC transporter ATP-binding protein n=1 Tax=Halomonas sp. TaxID=1486246 RepID=UPI003F92E6FC
MCSNNAVIALHQVAKRYRIFERPVDRLLTLLPGCERFARQRFFNGLQPLDLSITPGEVVGVVGRNGAGKSTLLQLICQTLPTTEGQLEVNGKISALLELGAGFNPDFTGRENVYLSASIIGMSKKETLTRMDDIIAFADIGEFIDQPVKTYSSGMFVRLAFAVATSVDPDILVVDEALSVGDGAFARKSFERIMAMKEAGKTILFCSHSLYQVEAICSRVLWIEAGTLMGDGEPDEIIPQYQRFLDTGLLPHEHPDYQGTRVGAFADNQVSSVADTDPGDTQHTANAGPEGYARLTTTTVTVDGETGRELDALSGHSTLSVAVAFTSDPALPCPTVAVTLSNRDGQIITSAATWEDNVPLARNAQGEGVAHLVIDNLPLLKGRYQVGAYVFCEQGIHSYGWVDPVATLRVTQTGVAKGVCRLPHRWEAKAP